MQYQDVYGKLTTETGVVTFLKKDGSIRIMLCTRNLHTVALEHGFQGQALGGHDNRCNIKNGNIAVFDLVLGEARSFNIDRLVNVWYFGEVATQKRYDEIFEEYRIYKKEYESKMPMSVDMSMLD